MIRTELFELSDSNRVIRIQPANQHRNPPLAHTAKWYPPVSPGFRNWQTSGPDLQHAISTAVQQTNSCLCQVLQNRNQQPICRWIRKNHLCVPPRYKNSQTHALIIAGQYMPRQFSLTDLSRHLCKPEDTPLSINRQERKKNKPNCHRTTKK